MPEYSVGTLAEFAEGDRRVVKCGEAEIGVFRVDGQFYAWHNACAHLGGPVCQGRIMRKVIEPTDAEQRTRTLEYDESDRLSWILSLNEDETYAVEVRVRHVF